ncbi:hypothetical protein QN277_002249 [Acacia crassicarpa]|uniref:F-box domain-containing protein n=1 Tax=Acacia crassicarpa TaxID=499986 RepID=A0AAE1NAE0_9FABA|nr:hypothetical protein QN277_002249 [Acacia crassicarpa]
MGMMEILPRECICKIISFTTPKDACRSSAVSSAFKECVDSDETWEAFLPSDCRDLISRSSSPNLISLPTKQLYLHLADHPLLLADKTMSFSLAKESGKKCYMIGAKGLCVIWGDTPRYWNWICIPQSRFSHVAELNHVWWFEVKGSLNIKLLSPKTQYDVFFIFMFGNESYGFTEALVNFSITKGGEGRSLGVVLDPPGIEVMQREDGWMEVKAGEFFTEEEEGEGLVEFRAWQTEAYIKAGIFIEGIEFRPTKIE